MIDADLVSLSLGGDDRAFAVLVDRYRDRVFGTLMATVNDPQAAEDLTQEVFVSFWRSLDRFQVHRPVMAWLYTIAVNLGKNHVRDVSRDPYSVGNPKAVDPLTPELILLGEEFEKGLVAALEKLPPSHRAAFELQFYDGLSYAEMGERLGLPQGTVKIHVHRARLELREILDPYLGG